MVKGSGIKGLVVGGDRFLFVCLLEEGIGIDGWREWCKMIGCSTGYSLMVGGSEVKGVVVGWGRYGWWQGVLI